MEEDLEWKIEAPENKTIPQQQPTEPNDSEWKKENQPVSEMSKEEKLQYGKKLLGLNKGYFDSPLRDFTAYALRGGQYTANALGQVAQKISEQQEKIPGYPALQQYVQQKTGIGIPRVDIREETGLGKNNPVDLGKLLESQHPNALAEFAGKNWPAILSNSLLKSALYAGVTRAMSADPERQNYLLPQGGVGAAAEEGIKGGIESYALGKAFPYAAKAASGLINMIKSPFSKVNYKDVAKMLQNHYETNINNAVGKIKYVGQELINNGADVVQGNINPMINRAYDVLPKTKANLSLLVDASSGQFEALRKLQSTLYDEASKNMSPLKSAADRELGVLMHEVRNEINNTITNHISRSGNEHLLPIYKEAINTYRRMKEAYFDPNLPKAIPKLIGKAKQIPKNLMDILQTESDPMSRLFRENPLAKSMVEKHVSNTNALNNLKWLTGVSSAAGALSYGANKLYNLHKSTTQKNL